MLFKTKSIKMLVHDKLGASIIGFIIVLALVFIFLFLFFFVHANST